MTRLTGKPLRLLQITDPHLGASSDETLLGLNTADSLAYVLKRAKSREPYIDVVIASGDISNDGTSESYERFIAMVRKHLPGVPVAWLEGNHDDPENMHNVSFAPPQRRYLNLGEWRVILLNSRVPFEERGEVPQSELTRLSNHLASDPMAPTMIFLHHQLVPVGSAWIDQYVVSNAQDFFDVIDGYDNVKAVCWGHVHQEFFAVRNGVDLLATPSTCVQFKPQSDDFLVDNLMPGYRIFELDRIGHYHTDIQRISEQMVGIDYVSSGY